MHIMVMNPSVTGISIAGIHLNSDIQRGTAPVVTKGTPRSRVTELDHKIRKELNSREFREESSLVEPFCRSLHERNHW